MAKLGRPRVVPQARCPSHRSATVSSMGTRQTPTGPRRRYRCQPLLGKPHTFSVALDDDGEVQERNRSAPPKCPRGHVGGKVVRDGTYGIRTPQPRQRYLCAPADGSTRHRFTPPLPRDHVHEQEHGCVECEELRGVHHGETAVARRHSWPTRIVARALTQLADAGSYADVSRQAGLSAELAASRHEALVASGLSADDADVAVEAEAAAADRGEAPPAAEAAVAAARDEPVTPAVRADLARYRRRRRTPQEMAEARAAAAAAAADPDAEEAAPTPTADPDPAGEPADPQAPPAKRRSRSGDESRNAWHIAADWTEAFGPPGRGRQPHPRPAPPPRRAPAHRAAALRVRRLTPDLQHRCQGQQEGSAFSRSVSSTSNTIARSAAASGKSVTAA